MAKTKTRYVCSACGSIQMKWMGKCPDCDEWNTLEEQVVRVEKGRTSMPGTPVASPHSPLRSVRFRRTVRSACPCR